jgi:hypothetical protein
VRPVRPVIDFAHKLDLMARYRGFTLRPSCPPVQPLSARCSLLCPSIETDILTSRIGSSVPLADFMDN